MVTFLNISTGNTDSISDADFIDALSGDDNVSKASDIIAINGKPYRLSSFSGFGTGAGGASLLTASVRVTSAQVKNSGITPVNIIAATAGKTIIPLMSWLEMTFNSVAYATHGNLSLKFPSASKSLFYISETNFLFSTASSNCVFPIDSALAGARQFIQGEALKLSTEFGNPTAGDSDITVNVVYLLI
jgi:hypothetical protein